MKSFRDFLVEQDQPNRQIVSTEITTKEIDGPVVTYELEIYGNRVPGAVVTFNDSTNEVSISMNGATSKITDKAAINNIRRQGGVVARDRIGSGDRALDGEVEKHINSDDVSLELMKELEAFL